MSRMRPRRPIAVLLATIALSSFPAIQGSPAPRPPRSDSPPREAADTPYLIACSAEEDTLKDDALLITNMPSYRATDTVFYLYGWQHDRPEGTFEAADGTADHQGWISVDRTEQLPSLWQVSTFEASTLDGDGSSGGDGDGTGNQAWWAGRSAEDEPGWETAPGYGNDWSATLEWRATASNPAEGQTVGLTFAFHHDTEPSYDFFEVQYLKADEAVTVFTTSGSNAPFAAPGVQYPNDVATQAQDIIYDGNDYSGDNSDEIILRLRVTSDLYWSDEDGLWPTTHGAAIVDDITVTYNTSEQSFTDVDNSNDWSEVGHPYDGDFAKVRQLPFFDIDPCRDNPSPQWSFVDDGTPPNNSVHSSLDGGTAGNATYGFPDLVTLPHLALDLEELVHNEIWSPEIEWDLPATNDDGPEIAGAFLCFTVWDDLPAVNGYYRTWRIRSYTTSSGTWSAWKDNGFAYYSNGASWDSVEVDVSHLLPAGESPERIQIALGVVDLADLFTRPGLEETPSPTYDNVSFAKYMVGGPAIVARQTDLFMDAFPQSGQATFQTVEDRRNADCRLDTRDIGTGPMNVPGDSLVVHVVPVISGSSVDLMNIDLVWILDVNPLFEGGVRAMPSGSTLIAGGAANGWDQWIGTTDADTATANGVWLRDHYFFDPPDEGFLHPGDVLRYYIRAIDSDARESTLPADIGGFATGRADNRIYDPRFTVHGLPSVTDNSGTQPSILFVNDFGFRGGINDVYQAFDQNGWRRGIEWDMFTVWAPSCRLSNGIGSASAHGATADQLAGYSILIYDAGDLSGCLLSDGTNTGDNDKGDDIGTMTGWFNADADRFLAYFGDDGVSALLESSPAAGGPYVQTILGVNLIDNNVRDDIEDQTAPVVVPAPGSPCFVEEYLAFGGCPGPNQFDNIGPLTGAVQSHFFTNPDGVTPYPEDGTRCASVTWDRLDANLNRKVSIAFPYGFAYVWNKSGSTRPNPNSPGGPDSQRARLLREILEDCFGHALGAGGGPVDVPDVPFRGFRDLSARPNPFNPAVAIRFYLGARGLVSVRVYNVRGELVETVHEGILDGGRQELVWRGLDHRGQAVASGVYIGNVTAFGQTQSFKLALLR
jgi:hypothetical protein